MEKELIELSQAQKGIIKKVADVSIVSTETLQVAVGLTQELKQARTRAEEVRKFFVDPLNKQVKGINAKFKPFIDTLIKAESEVKGKMEAYETGQEKLRLAEEERLRRLQEKKFARETAKAEKKGVETPPPPPPIKVEKEQVSGYQVRKVWDFEITDIKKIPAEYLIPDEKKIRKVVSAGLREIPGVRIFEKTISAVLQNKEDEL